MKNRLIAVAAIALAMYCPLSNAGSTTGLITAHFTFEVPGAPPLLFVFISTTAANPAACGTTTAASNRWVTRTDTLAGLTHMNALFLAKRMGRAVTITGKDGYFPNACDTWGDTESIQSVQMAD